tara:strand:- start:726 stop:1592 length:867 start_codon:yes stop_codon:yes gene_type:complete
MSKTIQSTNFADIVKDIDSFYIDNAVKVWCPWLKQTLKYKPLSVQQIKRFIELQVKAQKSDNHVVASFELIDEMNKVVTENCLDNSTGLLKKLSILDREAIVVQLRAYTKPELEVTDEGNELVIVDLKEVVDALKESKFPKDLKTTETVFDFGDSNILLTLELPTLYKDNLINGFFKNRVKAKFKKGNKQIEKDLDKFLGEIYFIELCKYINTLTINRGGEETIIRFDAVDTLNQSLQLLEKLPSNLIGAISGYVNEVKEFRDGFLSYVDSRDNRASLDVDAAIFTGI